MDTRDKSNKIVPVLTSILKRKAYRDKPEITYDILKVLSGGGMPRTRLMMLAILSYEQLKDHLNSMEKLQLLHYADDSDNKIYMTDKGQEFMKRYDQLMSLFDTRKIE